MQETHVSTPVDLPADWSIDVVDPGSAEFGQACAIELEVFAEMGYTASESSTGSCVEYEPWADRSRFVIISDEFGDTRGLVRIILGGYAEIPAGKLPTELAPDGVGLEYASLAVLPGDRGAGVAEALYRAVWVEALRSGAEFLAAVVDTWLLDLLVVGYGWPFAAVGPPTWHMGGNVVPIAMPIPELYVDFPSQRPEMAKWVFDGLTIEERQRFGIPVVL